tara:strand:+ start:1814 stop:2233 length:420 start_codon:yes stop_codon:yes gene_type:complete
MPIVAPLIAIAGSTVVRKAVQWGVIYVVGSEVVAWTSDEAGETQTEIEDRLLGEGAQIIDEAVAALGDVSLDFIRGFIPALIDGIAAGYDAIREGFRGKEPETIAALTIGILVVITILTIRHEVGTGPQGAGEYARFSE